MHQDFGIPVQSFEDQFRLYNIGCVCPDAIYLENAMGADSVIICSSIINILMFLILLSAEDDFCNDVPFGSIRDIIQKTDPAHGVFGFQRFSDVPGTLVAFDQRVESFIGLCVNLPKMIHTLKADDSSAFGALLLSEGRCTEISENGWEIIHPKNSNRVMKILQDLVKEQHIAVVMITHNTAFRCLADHCVVMSAGTIVEDVRQPFPQYADTLELR